MRSISFILLFTLIGCRKEDRISKELMITVENECYCKITFYKAQDSSFITSDYWDCTQTKALYILVKTGSYIVVADNNRKEVKVKFEKTDIQQNLTIEFP